MPRGGFSLTVADTGIGMSPDEVTKALEPFGQIETPITTRNMRERVLGCP